MSTAPMQRHGSADTPPRPPVDVIDDSRGSGGMWLFIATEASLFLMFFFSYYYLASGNYRWYVEDPPKLKLALTMLAILIVSSVVLHWGEKQIKKERHGPGRVAAMITLVLGIVFIALQVLEYRNHLQHLKPTSNAYGSIFYTITSFHAAHLILGMIMLIYVLILPRLEPAQRPPHRPYHNAALYWHFVDVVWILIVALLYVTPNLRTL